MSGTFACPECGSEIRPVGSGPGRRARCDDCLTLVEIPYLPRASGRGGAGAPRLGYWGLIGLAAVLLIAAAATLAVRSQARARRARAIVARVAMADQSERVGQYAEARDALAAALGLAESDFGARPEQISTWRARRDDLARKADQTEAEAREARAAAEVEAGRRALDAGRGASALAAAERAREADPDQDEAAWALAARVVARFGVAFEPPRGRFLEPDHAAAYRSGLYPGLAEALRLHGYLPRPAASPFAALWDEAPFRVGLEVGEAYGEPYLGSPQRTSRIEAHLVLRHGEATVWQTRLTARTPDLESRLTPYASSRFANGKNRLPEIERQLYKAAVGDLAERVSSRLKTLPKPPGAA